MKRPAVSGFTLLEVMVAVAIMAMALVLLLGIVTNNVRAAAHARQITTATLLARSKIAAVEDTVLETGFVDTDQDEEGDFSDDAEPNFKWHTLIEKVELPANAASQAQQAADQAQQSALSGTSSGPLDSLTGMVGGLLTSFVEPIRVGLESSVRRVTVTVTWHEVARGDQTFELITYMTDPAKLDLAMPSVGGAADPAAGASTPNAAGSTPGGATPGTPGPGGGATPGVGARAPAAVGPGGRGGAR